MQTLDPLVSACFPARPPDIFSLARYLHYLLQPRRDMHIDTIPIVQPELITATSDPSTFTPAVLQQAETYLTTLEQPEQLSSLIQNAQRAGESIVVLEALVFLVMDYFDPQDAQKPDDLPVAVCKVDGQLFRLCNIAGEEVLLVPTPKEAQHAS